MSHTFTVLSRLPLTKNLASGEKAREKIGLLWPSSGTVSFSPGLATLIVLSIAKAEDFPSDENAKQVSSASRGALAWTTPFGFSIATSITFSTAISFSSLSQTALFLLYLYNIP